MKTIQLKEGIVVYPNAMTAPVTTAQLILAAIDNIPEKGFTIADLRARGRIADAVENCDGATQIELEDADFATLKKCVADMRWAVRSGFIVDFVDQFD